MVEILTRSSFGYFAMKKLVFAIVAYYYVKLVRSVSFDKLKIDDEIYM